MLNKRRKESEKGSHEFEAQRLLHVMNTTGGEVSATKELHTVLELDTTELGEETGTDDEPLDVTPDDDWVLEEVLWLVLLGVSDEEDDPLFIISKSVCNPGERMKADTRPGNCKANLEIKCLAPVQISAVEREIARTC